MAGVDAYVVLLMHCDGSGTSFTDTSASAHTLTAHGSVAQSTAQKVFGAASMYCPGGSDYVTAPDSADWLFQNADFTVDFRIRFVTVHAADILHQNTVDSNNWTIGYDYGNTHLEYRAMSGGGLTFVGRFNCEWTPSTNTWYHIAIVRSGTTCYMFIDGVSQVVTQVVAFGTCPDMTSVLSVGSEGWYFGNANYYLDELRISKGVARWTSNFTPPTEAYSPPSSIKTINGLNMAAGAGVWSSGGNLATARNTLAGCGTQTAGLSFGHNTTTEEYNGTSWSSGGDLATGRQVLAGCGTQTAGLSFGGYISANSAVTEEYNGTSWSSGGDLATARRSLAGCGTQTAGLSFGGITSGYSAVTEEYDGTSWSAGGALATGRGALAGCGTQTAGLSFGGSVPATSAVTEEYDGTSWSSGGNLATARYELGGCGVQTAGLSFGGTTGSNSAVTEEYNGTSWSSGGNLATARTTLAGCGTQSAGLSFGGWVSTVSAVTEEYGPVPPAIKTINGRPIAYVKTWNGLA